MKASYLALAILALLNNQQAEVSAVKLTFVDEIAKALA